MTKLKTPAQSTTVTPAKAGVEGRRVHPVAAYLCESRGPAVAGEDRIGFQLHFRLVGIGTCIVGWIPACAGMSGQIAMSRMTLDSGLRRNDEVGMDVTLRSRDAIAPGSSSPSILVPLSRTSG
jgi:hypothetical protein